MQPFGDSASIVLGFGLTKLQMLSVMGPLEKGRHIGKWGKISMEPCRRFEIRLWTRRGTRRTRRARTPSVHQSGRRDIHDHPVSFEFHEGQLNVRGGQRPPNV